MKTTDTKTDSTSQVYVGEILLNLAKGLESPVDEFVSSEDESLSQSETVDDESDLEFELTQNDIQESYLQDSKSPPVSASAFSLDLQTPSSTATYCASGSSLDFTFQPDAKKGLKGAFPHPPRQRRKSKWTQLDGIMNDGSGDKLGAFGRTYNKLVIKLGRGQAGGAAASSIMTRFKEYTTNGRKNEANGTPTHSLTLFFLINYTF